MIPILHARASCDADCGAVAAGRAIGQPDVDGHGQHAVVRNGSRGAAQAEFAALDKAAVIGISSSCEMAWHGIIQQRFHGSTGIGGLE